MDKLAHRIQSLAELLRLILRHVAANGLAIGWICR
jgi:hypothetical protein